MNKAWLHRRRIRMFRRDRDGVSPVIGTILILVIMILAIAGILAWGVPAIQGLQDNAEYQAVLTQFLQMDSDVRNLRDPQNTRISTLTLAEGTLSFGNGDRWVIMGARDSGYDALHLNGWEGSNPASVDLVGVALPASAEITVDKVSGGSFVTKFSCPGACSTNVNLGGALLDTDVVRIQVKDGTVKAEIWIFNVGRLDYRLSDASDQYQLHFEMGAVFSQQGDAYFVEDSPTMKDPDYGATPTDTSLFLRVMQLTGGVQGVSGKGRFPLVYHLIDNYGASRGRPSFDPATAVRVQVNGLMEAPFCNYLDARSGWTAQDNTGATAACPAKGTAGFVSVQYSPGAQSLVFDMSHSVVTTTVRSL